MNLQNKRFQVVLDRINQNLTAARMVSNISKMDFHFDSDDGEYKYNLTNESTRVYLGVGIAFDPYPQIKTKGHISYQTPQIHRIGAVPELLLNKGRYFGNIWSGIETGDEKDKYRQFLNLYFDGKGLNGDQVGKTRSKAAPVVDELSDLIRKKDSNHLDVLRAVDLSFKLLTFSDRDAVDLIGEIG